MAVKNSNKSKLKMNTSTRKSTLTLVTLPNFSISSADISPEMLKLGRVTKVKVLFLVLVFVFNFIIKVFIKIHCANRRATIYKAIRKIRENQF